MPFNGSGVFTRVYNWVNDAAANITITASRADGEDDGFATGLSTCITKNGQTTITANLPMATFRHTGVGDAVSRTDYASAGQTQDGTLNWVAAGGTADVITAAYSPAITALGDGQLCYIRTTATNATTTPTFSPNGLLARTIVKNSGTALVAGDLPLEAVLRYNLANTRWELLNPVYPFVPLTAPFSDATAIIKGSGDPTKLLRFEVDGFTAGNTRVITPPNYDGTMATLAGTETLTNKTLTDPDVSTQAVDNNTTKAASTAYVLGQVASQANMEAASSNVKFVTPGRQHFHPGMYKAWVYLTGSAGTYTAQASYNYTSITDNGVGDLTINWAVTMSSINYGVHAFAGFGGSRPIIAYKGAANTATTSRIKMVDTANNADDTDFLFVGIVGDI
jgi:hypothetical protein